MKVLPIQLPTVHPELLQAMVSRIEAHTNDERKTWHRCVLHCSTHTCSTVPLSSGIVSREVNLATLLHHQSMVTRSADVVDHLGPGRIMPGWKEATVVAIFRAAPGKLKLAKLTTEGSLLALAGLGLVRYVIVLIIVIPVTIPSRGFIGGAGRCAVRMKHAPTRVDCRPWLPT